MFREQSKRSKWAANKQAENSCIWGATTLILYLAYNWSTLLHTQTGGQFLKSYCLYSETRSRARWRDSRNSEKAKRVCLPGEVEQIDERQKNRGGEDRRRDYRHCVVCTVAIIITSSISSTSLNTEWSKKLSHFRIVIKSYWMQKAKEYDQLVLHIRYAWPKLSRL